MARRGDYVMRDATFAEAAMLIRAEHYARGCSNTAVYAHGLFRGGDLVGAALWLPPTKPCAKTVHPDWRRVLSLSRLAVRPSEPQNAESILIGWSIRKIRREKRWKALVTFADTRLGHTGTIYRATNWVDCGLTKPQPCWVDSVGRQVATLSTKTRTKAKMQDLGFIMIGRFAKRKFTMVLNSTAALFDNEVGP